MAYIIVFFFILYVESYLFSKHNIFFILFSLCALFLKQPTLFLRLARPRPEPCVFDNIELNEELIKLAFDDPFIEIDFILPEYIMWGCTLRIQLKLKT
ncbi:hypothetical protein Hanom_Chr09g00818441 [Helianthus anomalus]